MSFRRFLYLTADDFPERSYSLRRIDMSRLFFRGSTEGTPAPLDIDGTGVADLSTVQDAGSLPDPAIILSPPDLPHSVGVMNFMLFKNKKKICNGGEESNKVVCIDNMGRSLMVDPDLSPTTTVRALPSLSSPKLMPFALSIGQSLYVMDTFRKRQSFHLLSNASRYSTLCEDWHWDPLDLPPIEHSRRPHDWQIIRPDNHYQTVDSYTVVAGSKIVVSSKASNMTYIFNTLSKAWRKHKAGDWVLPFHKFAEYVPEQKLWFGISSSPTTEFFTAANLVAYPGSAKMRHLPEVRGCWKEYADPPPEWSLAASYAVHLGSSRFCLARFFHIGEIDACPDTHRSYKGVYEIQLLLTGVEVDGCYGQGGLRVLNHKSELYKLDANVSYQVL